MARVRGDINFTANDRLYACGVSLGVKLQDTEHIAMIGNRHGRHAILFGPLDKIADTDGSIKQAVLGMHVKMNEIGVLHGCQEPKAGFSIQNTGQNRQEW
jgi:hypothetical protein